MKLIIQSPLEYFIIGFSKESVFYQSEMTVTPEEQQETIFHLLESECSANPRLKPPSYDNIASPRLVKAVFDSLGYEVLTCPSYEEIESKEQAEKDEMIRNYKPEGIAGIDYPSGKGLIMD